MKTYTTQEMITLLQTGDKAEHRCEDKTKDYHVIVEKKKDGSIRILKNGDSKEYIGEPLPLTAKVMAHTWCIHRNYVDFYKAMEEHNKGKTVIYHHDKETQYEFRNEMDPGQFTALHYDSICLYELIQGKWTIKE